jgi:hypothetical protein
MVSVVDPSTVVLDGIAIGAGFFVVGKTNDSETFLLIVSIDPRALQPE